MTRPAPWTNPAVITLASGDDLTVAVDCTAILTDGQAPTVVDLTLVARDGATTVGLPDLPLVVDTQVQQRIPDGLLEPDLAPYRLTLRVQPSGTEDIYTNITVIDVPA